MTTAETRAGVLPEMADVPAPELRVGVLGVGMMGADHVARLHSRISGARVVAVSDAFTGKAEQVAGDVPGCRVVADPLLVVFETAGGRMVDVECFVRTGVAYEVRTEVVAEDGSAMIGLDLGLVRQSGGSAGAVRATGIALASGSASVAPTTSRCSAGWTRPAAARSTARAPGTVMRPRPSARPVSRRCVRSGGPRSGWRSDEDRPGPADAADDAAAGAARRRRRDGLRVDGALAAGGLHPVLQAPPGGPATVRALRSALESAGVGVTSLLPVMRWSGPGEVERQATVRYWKRAIEICVELGVDTMNSEFNGRPEVPELAEAMFWRSMEELLPVFEREGVRLVLEPHPDDFIELGHPAIDLIRGLDSPTVTFLYCMPHTFHQGDDAAGIIAHAGDLLTHVHVADSMDHTASDGLRYITNPPGNPVRVHQHMELGRRDVDADAAFAALAGIGFDGVVTTCVFGRDAEARESGTRMLGAIRELVTKHYPDGTVP